MDCKIFVHVPYGSFNEKRDKHIRGCFLQDNEKLAEIEYSSKEHISLVSTITQSTSASSQQEIPRNYFITKDQKVNQKYKSEGGDAYKTLKASIVKYINNTLKSMMIIKSLQTGIKVIDKKTKQVRLIQTYNDIGLAWKSDDSTECASKINMIMNNTFTESSGYEIYLEIKITKKIKLKYTEDVSLKGSIARMIILRKCKLAKVINK